ncbi:MAG: hypothetical protein AAFQ35_05645 [Pseudomonadota bacterium]
MTSMSSAGDGARSHASDRKPSLSRSDALASEVKSDMKNAKRRLREEARERARERKRQAATQVNAFADVLQDSADSMEEKELGWASDMTRDVADRVQSFGDTLEDRDLDDMAQSVRRFARQRPAAFVGGALLLGFAVGRFLQSSDERDRQDYVDEDDLFDDEHETHLAGSYGHDHQGQHGNGAVGSTSRRTGARSYTSNATSGTQGVGQSTAPGTAPGNAKGTGEQPSYGKPAPRSGGGYGATSSYRSTSSNVAAARGGNSASTDTDDTNSGKES